MALRAGAAIACWCTLLLLCSTSLALSHAQQRSGAYIIPLQQRTGVVRSRESSSSGGRHLLGAGKVQVGGSVHDGYFYAVLRLGTPPQLFNVIVDTGSTMTYVPCYDCLHCGTRHVNKPFNPSKSSTAQWVPCGDATCTRQPRIMSCSRQPTLPHDGPASQDDITRAVQKAVKRHYGGAASATAGTGGSSSGAGNGQCVYSITYAESSSSEGALVRDVFTFPNNVTRVPVTVGCESGETGLIYSQAPDGLLGLGNNPGTFVSELAASGAIPHVFSLCFGYPTGGALLLGDPPLKVLPLGPAGVPLPPAQRSHHTPQPPAFTWTPLLPSPRNDYYTVKVTSFTLGGTNLETVPGLFDRGHGTLLDSGTTYMYLPTAAYQAFAAKVSAAASAAGLKRITDQPYHDLCWSGARLAPDFANLADIFPTGEIRFQGGGLLRLPPIRYMFQYTRGAYCLGVFDNYVKGTLLGGVATRNMLVQYDSERRRVGLADVDCAALGRQPPQQFNNLPLSEKPAVVPAAAAAAPAHTPPRTTGQQQQPQHQAEQRPIDHKHQQPPAAAAAGTAAAGTAAGKAVQQAVQREYQQALGHALDELEKAAEKMHHQAAASAAAAAAGFQSAGFASGVPHMGPFGGPFGDKVHQKVQQHLQQRERGGGGISSHQQEGPPAPAAASAAAAAPSAAAAVTKLAGSSSSSTNSSSSSSGGSTPPAPAAAAAAPHPSPAPSPKPPVYWGSHGSSILKESDLAHPGQPQQQQQQEPGTALVVALLVVLVLLVGGGAGAYHVWGARLQEAWRARLSPEQRGFMPVAAADEEEPVGYSRGGGEQRYGGGTADVVGARGGDVRGGSSSSSSSSWQGGGKARPGGSAAGGGSYIAMTAASHFGTGAAGGAAGAAAAAAPAGAFESAAAGGGASSSSSSSSMTPNGRPAGGVSHGAGRLVTDEGGLAAVPDAVKGSPGGRDQTSPPRTGGGGGTAGVASQQQQQQQQQQQPQMPDFSAQFSIEDGDDHLPPPGGAAGGGGGSAAAVGVAAGGGMGPSEQSGGFQSISLE